MPLNKSRGNMYDFVSHTWNPIKGACMHDCSYCYMKKYGDLGTIRLVEKELRVNLGSGNFIFVGSGCDVFAPDVHDFWIHTVMNHCSKYDNRYLFQSKNPGRMKELIPSGLDAVVCTTIETNRWYPEIMRNTIPPEERASAMSEIDLPKYVTIEPIIDFDVDLMLYLIRLCGPEQVNIGADSMGTGLPEPSNEKLLALIDGLGEFAHISQKINLARLLQ